jgi:hypothetical protein
MSDGQGWVENPGQTRQWALYLNVWPTLVVPTWLHIHTLAPQGHPLLNSDLDEAGTNSERYQPVCLWSIVLRLILSLQVWAPLPRDDHGRGREPWEWCNVSAPLYHLKHQTCLVRPMHLHGV